MSTRKIKDAIDLETNEAIYFIGHAKATYMSDGTLVEDAVNGKVSKVEGKQLSTEDFTTALKTKLESLESYDDSAIEFALQELRTDFDTLVSGDTATAIESFNEIIAFLDGVEDSESLDSIIASIEQQIAAKQDKITDLETIRQGASKGATAVQSSDLASVATSGSYEDLSDKPIIPSAVTESTVSGWGFTKNSGTYSKPSDGIPKSDLASAVQTSLGKADTALQSYTEQYTGTVKTVKINGEEKSPDSNGLVDLGTIEGGSSSGMQYHEWHSGSGTDSITLNPGIYYIIVLESDVIDSYTVAINLNAAGIDDTTGTLEEFTIEFTPPDELTMISLPSDLTWANDDVPALEAGKTYVISIVNNLAVYAEF